MAEGTIILNKRTSVPTTPAANKVKLYNKNGILYSLDEAGTELSLSGVPSHHTTHENGGSDQISVAGLTGLLATAQTPAAHKTSHQKGGSDAIEISSMGTTETDTTKRLAPDGSNGVAWVAGSSGTYDSRDILIDDHFIVGNTSSDTVGKAGWRVLATGTGADISVTPEVGHPGVLDFGLGTAAAGRAGIYLGDSGSGFGNFFLGTTQNTITMEWLVKFSTTALSTANMLRWTCGFGDEWGSSSTTQHTNGIYIDFEPGTDTHFRLRTASASTRSASATTITVAASTWYRLAITITYPAGVPTATLFINGTSRATLTTNFPTAVMGVGTRGDAQTGATEARFQVDYCTLTQVTNKET